MVTLLKCSNVGDSTAKVVNSEQITTIDENDFTSFELVILPQR